jgi:glycosyltransferase involved in cell wall biosynthesis
MLGEKKSIKVIIQIPCLNEELTLPVVLSELPRKLPGVDVVEWLVIDDGCTDNTVEVAKQHGVDHIVSHPKNLGLAVAFMTGIQESLKKGADIIVNTDADNQYKSEFIPALIAPILENRAEFIVGARPISDIDGFSKIKKILQKIGSWVVRLASDTNIPDVTSGFRAMSSHAAKRLNVFSQYTYTLETIIQAGRKGFLVTWVPVETNADLRESRLLSSIPSYIARSINTIIRILIVYRPFRFFALIGTTLFLIGALLFLRFFYFYFFSSGVGHIQSLVVAGAFTGIGYHTILIAFVADLISVNRLLLEKISVSQNN